MASQMISSQFFDSFWGRLSLDLLIQVIGIVASVIVALFVVDKLIRRRAQVQYSPLILLLLSDAERVLHTEIDNLWSIANVSRKQRTILKTNVITESAKHVEEFEAVQRMMGSLLTISHTVANLEESLCTTNDKVTRFPDMLAAQTGIVEGLRKWSDADASLKELVNMLERPNLKAWFEEAAEIERSTGKPLARQIHEVRWPEDEGLLNAWLRFDYSMRIMEEAQYTLSAVIAEAGARHTAWSRNPKWDPIADLLVTPLRRLAHAVSSLLAWIPLLIIAPPVLLALFFINRKRTRYR